MLVLGEKLTSYSACFLFKLQLQVILDVIHARDIILTVKLPYLW